MHACRPGQNESVGGWHMAAQYANVPFTITAESTYFPVNKGMDDVCGVPNNLTS